MFLKSQEHLRYKMTTFKAGLAQNTHWLCGNSSRGPTRWKSFPETRDHHLGSRSENTNSMADLLGPPQPPPRPVPSCPVRVGFNASRAEAGPELSMPGDPGSSFIHSILPFFTGSSVDRWASRLRQGLGGRASNRGWGPDRAGFPVGDRQWKSWEGRESRLRELSRTAF